MPVLLVGIPLVVAALAVVIMVQLPPRARVWTLGVLALLEAAVILALVIASIPNTVKEGYEQERLAAYLRALARCAAVPRLNVIGANSLRDLALDLDRGESVSDAVSAQSRTIHNAIDEALKPRAPAP